MPSTNWPKIKREYITTHKTTDMLAKKYGLSAGTVRNRCTQEKWVEARKKYNDKKTQKSLKMTMEKTVSQEAELASLIKEGKQLAASLIVEGLKSGSMQEPADIRRAVQSLCDLSNQLPQAVDSEEDDDGLVTALSCVASGLFEDGDDSYLLPQEDDE